MKYSLALLLLLIVIMPVSAKSHDAFELILSSLYQCYDHENKIGTALAECLLTKVKSSPNPDNYKVNIYDDNPSKTIESNITITIYNKYGQVFTYKGTAQAKIVIKACTAKKISPLTTDEELSISSP